MNAAQRPATPTDAARDTPTRLLDAAQQLVQARGYNAFSYKDLAAEIGIRTASIHYHFKTKADLGAALMDRYLDDLDDALTTIDRAGGDARARLAAFVDTYRLTESQGMLCLCGSLAADLATLPEPVGQRVARFLTRSETWVRDTIARGAAAGELAVDGDPSALATTLIASLQGGLLLARGRAPSAVVDVVAGIFFDRVRPQTPSPSP
ncbi:MAG: TetR/AcrR family transcriptional regulator [Acidobacteriota bacterium]